MKVKNNIDELSANTLRFLAIDAIQKANSGHPGMPMGCASIAHILFSKIMNHNPNNSKWINRDRFILSAGHGSMLLYGVLHLCGYKVSLEDIKNFRQYESVAPGHPEFGLTDGVETTTGPLGQGFANAVGMAITQEFLASRFNKEKYRILDHYIYVIAGDGDMMEGITSETASLAGCLKLRKLIVFYDNNGISIEGKIGITFTEDVQKRFEAQGWHIERVNDGNDFLAIENSIKKAKKQNEKPSLIIVDTHIGYGSPNKQDSESSHGSPLGIEEVKLTKKNLGWDENKEFYIPSEVEDYYCEVKKKNENLERKWNELFKEYSNAYPELADEFIKIFKGDYGDEWLNELPVYREYDKKIATREASGKALNAIAKKIHVLIGGSADLGPSNNTLLKEYHDFSSNNYSGRNLRFGIREHAMAGIINGAAYYGGAIVYGATFFVFSDYLRPSIRIAGISKIKPIFVFTHDSVGVGEDGPTHQPIEHLASLRAIPNCIVIRPADANETSQAWKIAIETKNFPVALILTRQAVPVINRDICASADLIKMGAYTIFDSNEEPEVILLASGSETSLIIEAAIKLNQEGIRARAVNFPSWELFEMQSSDYKESVLPTKVKTRIVVEAGVKMGWERYAGEDAEFITINEFGASAPAKVLFEKFGFTVDNIIEKIKKALNR